MVLLYISTDSIVKENIHFLQTSEIFRQIFSTHSESAPYFSSIFASCLCFYCKSVQGKTARNSETFGISLIKPLFPPFLTVFSSNFNPCEEQRLNAPFFALSVRRLPQCRFAFLF